MACSERGSAGTATAFNAERERIQSITKFVTPSETLDVIDYDPPDNRILECAAEAGSEFIVSEDKDLLRLRHHGNARIIRAAEIRYRSREAGAHSAAISGRDEKGITSRLQADKAIDVID